MWIGVIPRFRQFNESLIVTDDQRQDGYAKQFAARQALQQVYYGTKSDSPPGFLVGSWGKETQRRPPVDVDIFFVLPQSVQDRFNLRIGNRQSDLLQEVKGILATKWTQTDMRGDGQVVQIAFNSLTLEVVPAFAATGGQFQIPDTNLGGRWRTVDPLAEIKRIETVDQATIGNARRLMRMMKSWRDECRVPLESFVIEQTVAHFMSSYEHRMMNYYWYDWFVRDYLAFLIQHANGVLTMPGTGDQIPLGDEWLSRATSALDRAMKACDLERADKTIDAGLEWQKIFGTNIPVYVVSS